MEKQLRKIDVDIKFKDLRVAVQALNESGLLPKKINLVGYDRATVAGMLVTAIEGIEDVNGKFPGPRAALDVYNTIVEAEDKALKKAEKEAEKEAKGKVKEPKPEKAPKPEKEAKVKEPKAPKPEKAPKAPKPEKVPRITKKSIVIEGLRKKGGSSITEMAQKCTDAGLGDMELNIRVVGYWLPKIGFKVQKNKETGKWTAVD